MQQPIRLLLVPFALASRFILAGGVGLCAEPVATELDRRFASEVQPFLKMYCLDCHGKEKQEGKLNLMDMVLSLLWRRTSKSGKWCWSG